MSKKLHTPTDGLQENDPKISRVAVWRKAARGILGKPDPAENICTKYGVENMREAFKNGILDNLAYNFLSKASLYLSYLDPEEFFQTVKAAISTEGADMGDPAQYFLHNCSKFSKWFSVDQYSELVKTAIEANDLNDISYEFFMNHIDRFLPPKISEVIFTRFLTTISKRLSHELHSKLVSMILSKKVILPPAVCTNLILVMEDAGLSRYNNILLTNIHSLAPPLMTSSGYSLLLSSLIKKNLLMILDDNDKLIQKICPPTIEPIDFLNVIKDLISDILNGEGNLTFLMNQIEDLHQSLDQETYNMMCLLCADNADNMENFLIYTPTLSKLMTPAPFAESILRAVKSAGDLALYFLSNSATFLEYLGRKDWITVMVAAITFNPRTLEAFVPQLRHFSEEICSYDDVNTIIIRCSRESVIAARMFVHLLSFDNALPNFPEEKLPELYEAIVNCLVPGIDNCLETNSPEEKSIHSAKNHFDVTDELNISDDLLELLTIVFEYASTYLKTLVSEEMGYGGNYIDMDNLDDTEKERIHYILKKHTTFVVNRIKSFCSEELLTAFFNNNPDKQSIEAMLS